MAVKVNTGLPRSPHEVVAGFRSLLKNYPSVTPAVSDAMERLNAMNSDIRPLLDGTRVAGVALTCKTIAADFAPILMAIDVGQPDDILVIDTHHSKDTAFWGEFLSISCQNKGIVAVVMDCAMRDIVECRKIGFPVLSCGVAPNVAAVVGFGYVNVPIQCCGAHVNPGDVVVIDECGVVVAPYEEVNAVLERTTHILQNEEKVLAKIKAGATLGDVLDINKTVSASFDHHAKYDEKRAKGMI